MARLLANENVPGDVVAALLGDGHDVVWMQQVGPGSIPLNEGRCGSGFYAEGVTQQSLGSLAQ